MDACVGSTRVVAEKDVGSLPILVAIKLELEAERVVDVCEAEIDGTELRVVSRHTLNGNTSTYPLLVVAIEDPLNLAPSPSSQLREPTHAPVGIDVDGTDAA